MIRRLRRKRARHCQRGDGEGGDYPAIETNAKHQGSPSSRNLRQDLTRSLERELNRRHQAIRPSHRTMPRLALNRKDTAWRIDWQQRPDCRRFQPAGVVLVQKFYSPSRRVRDENF
jgi:hypothetical protein